MYYQYDLKKIKTYAIENNLMKYIILTMTSIQVRDAVINWMVWRDELISKFKSINGPPNGARLEYWYLEDALILFLWNRYYDVRKCIKNNEKNDSIYINSFINLNEYMC
jgi:hypothetical protein